MLMKSDLVVDEDRNERDYFEEEIFFRYGIILGFQ